MFVNKQKILVIVGPTASGKSALAVKLAKKFGAEIISADSRQVYRGLDIGTGKVTMREMQGVQHYLLDIASPRRIVTAHTFAQKANTAIAKIRSRDKLPIIAGGTGFYIDALLARTHLPNVPPNPRFRRMHDTFPVEKLFRMLQERDPQRARSMDTPSERGNKVRLIRALEVAAGKNKLPGQNIKGSPLYDALWIGIAPNLNELERRIRTRLRARIRSGMIAEGKRLHARGLSYKRMEQLGLEYRALSRLLQSKISRKEFEAELFRDIRRYAKKQLAYWKRNHNIYWYGQKQKARIARTVAAWLRLR